MNNGEGYLTLLRFFLRERPPGHFLYLENSHFERQWEITLPWNTSINWRPLDAKPHVQMKYGDNSQLSASWYRAHNRFPVPWCPECS